VAPSNDIAEFLASRRAKVTPEQAGLPTYGQRRVPGLRREEVASLAGMSFDYYKRLERGNASGVSDSVLEALARALQLDDAERAISTTSPVPQTPLPRGPAAAGSRRSGPWCCGSSTRWAPRPSSATAASTTLRPTRSAARSTRRCSRAASSPRTSARFTFLDAAAQDFYVGWERTAKDLVAHLRSEAGRNPYARGLSDLVGELSTRSEAFRTWWAAHNVRYHRTGTKRLRHPLVGELELSYEVMELPADDGLTISVYSADPGSRSREALDLLTSWIVTTDEQPDHASHEARRAGREAT
jgi:transcriptional regulator with XRE-family HTH domain